MMRPLRAALIGCGRIGSTMADDPLLTGDIFTHGEAYVRSAMTELVAVCDADAGAAERGAARWDAGQAFDDVETMLRTASPEIVSVCTPDDSHYAVARQTLENADRLRGLLVEKPLAMNAADAEALIALARKRGVVLAAMKMRRYADNFTALRKLLKSGELGDVTGVTGWYTKGTKHNGVHWFDMLRMLAGEPVWVEAHDVLHEAGDDPTLDVIMGLENGALATLRAAAATSFTLFEMDILTERARVRLTDSGHRIDIDRARPSPRYSGYTELVPAKIDLGHRRDLVLHAVEDLVRAIRNDRPPASTGEDALAALRIAATALKSAETGARVALAPSNPDSNPS